jgi:hypothetical protein
MLFRLQILVVVNVAGTKSSNLKLLPEIRKSFFAGSGAELFQILTGLGVGHGVSSIGHRVFTG